MKDLPADTPSFYYGEEPERDECQYCGSFNTFETYDHKLVCRDCWTIEDLFK